MVRSFHLFKIFPLNHRLIDPISDSSKKFAYLHNLHEKQTNRFDQLISFGFLPTMQSISIMYQFQRDYDIKSHECFSGTFFLLIMGFCNQYFAVSTLGWKWNY